MMPPSGVRHIDQRLIHRSAQKKCSRKFPAWGSKITHLGDAPSRVKLPVFEAFLDLVVLGTIAQTRQHLPRCRWYISTLIILPSELLNRIPGVKPHDRNDLYLIVVEWPAEELDTLVSRDLLVSYT